MKVVLCGINSKYVHTNLAIRYVEAYAKVHTSNINYNIVEDTINTEQNKVLENIFNEEPDVIAFSVYIWNVNYILELCKKIKKEKPEILICLGGPEVSFVPEKFLQYDFIDFVQCGEGEKPMTELFNALDKSLPIPEDMGVCYKECGEIILSEPYFEADLDSLESPYTDEYLKNVSGRLAYFEASRGCPFSCAFCLSGGCAGVRNFNMDYVKKSLLALWNSGTTTIKFVDRTFNADRRRADEIISFIIKNSPNMPKVCFHFEIAADILSDSTLDLLKDAPCGLFQIEAGLQSFNQQTLMAVTRKNNVEKICEKVKKILEFKNIHTHIDLIAGLPYEDFESFKDSFNKAYDLGADMLQLGFLKLLHGSKLREKSAEYNIEFDPKAPYTVKSTKWLDESELEKLYAVEDANEKINNSGRFKKSLEYVLKMNDETPFELFLGFGKKQSMPLDKYTDELFEYFLTKKNVNRDVLRDYMCIDRMSTNNTGIFPESLKIHDERLSVLAKQLDEVPKEKGAKRVICILYTQNRAVYADYNKGDLLPYKLNFIDI